MTVQSKREISTFELGMLVCAWSYTRVWEEETWRLGTAYSNPAPRRLSYGYARHASKNQIHTPLSHARMHTYIHTRKHKPVVMRENVEAVVVPQHHRVPRGVKRRRRELPAGRVRRVVERALHAAVSVVKHHLFFFMMNGWEVTGTTLYHVDKRKTLN